jgi:hypothetical protein
LVFAPEQQVAFFGGDPDNFEYPRFDLDICLFRAYEDGKPVKVPHYLKWSKSGAAEGELTFVSGHPGRTERLLTVAELEYLRDRQYPISLAYLKRREVLLRSWSERSGENARRAKDELFGIQNSRKARDGGHAGLYDPALMESKRQQEKALRMKFAANPAFASAAGAYDRIQQAQSFIARYERRHRLLEAGQAFQSELFDIAHILVRAAEEYPKADGERLREFAEAGRASLEMGLFSDKPIHNDLEILNLADSLTYLSEQLGAEDPVVKKVLAGKSPRARAAELITGSRLRSVDERRRLYKGGMLAIAASDDPLILVAKSVDAEAREVRQLMEAQAEIKKQAHAAIASARFALEGKGQYPDATFTLRLSYGVVKGYTSQGKAIPATTSLGGIFERSAEMEGRPPFDLPERWQKKRRALHSDAPFNFVSTHDIIGGNSGSPVVNRNGEFVGIIFDGNIESLVLGFAYEETQARALSVHSAGILEALRSVYSAKPLVEELVSGKRR